MGILLNTNPSFLTQTLQDTFPSGYGFLRETLGLHEMTIGVGVIGITTLAAGTIGAYCVSPKVRSLVNRCVSGQPSSGKNTSMSLGEKRRQSMEIRTSSDPIVTTVKTSSPEKRLYDVCCKKDVGGELFPLLKKADVNKSVRGETSLHALCRNGHSLFVDLLLSRGADPTIRNRDGKMAFSLLSPDQLNQRFLVACLGDDEQVAQLILDCGAEVNIKDGSGNTPLHYACVKGFKKLAISLLDKEAEIDAPNTKGETPLGCACLFGQSEIIDLLKGRGASGEMEVIDDTDPMEPTEGKEEEGSSNQNDTSVRVYDREELTELEELQKKYKLPKRENVNAENDEGRTLLRAACGKGDVEDILKLLALGANSRVLDEQGRRCFDFLSLTARYNLFKERHQGRILPQQWMRPVGSETVDGNTSE